MTYSIILEKVRCNNIRLKVSGKINKNNSDRFFKEIIGHFNSSLHKSMVIDTRKLNFNTGITDGYFYAKSLAENGFRFIPKLFFLSSGKHREFDLFFKTAARNWGISIFFLYNGINHSTILFF